MATWAYPPLPADKLKAEEEDSLVSVPFACAYFEAVSLIAVGQRARVATNLVPRTTCFAARRAGGMRRAIGSQRTRVHSGPIISPIRECKGVRD
jgi:hypothetical protein